MALDQPEPIIRQWAGEELGLDIQKDLDHSFRVHPAYEFLTASLDSWTENKRDGFMPVELKRVGRHNRGKWFDEYGETAPMNYQIQCGHQMMVTGANTAILVGMVDESELLIRYIHRDENFERLHLERCLTFWQRVTDKLAPEPDETPQTSDAIAAIFKKPTPGKVIELPVEVDVWTKELEQIAATTKEIDKRERYLKNQIKLLLMDAESGVTPGGMVWEYREKDIKGYTVQSQTRRELRRGKALQPTGSDA